METKIMLCGKYRDKSEFCFKLVAPEQRKCLYAYADTSAEIDRWISMISKAVKNHKQRHARTRSNSLKAAVDSPQKFQLRGSNARVASGTDSGVNNPTHRVIKTFEGTGESELSVSEGDIVQILEPVDSNGWVRVMRCHAGACTSGFVPNDYISALTKEERAAISSARRAHAAPQPAPQPSPPPAPGPPSGPKPRPPSYRSRMPQSSRAARSRFRNAALARNPATAITNLHKKAPAPTHSAPSNAATSTSTFKAVGRQNDGDAVDLLALTKNQLHDLLLLNDLPGYATQFLREGVNGNDLATFNDVDFEDFSGLKFQLRKLKRLIGITKAWGVDLPSLELLSGQLAPAAAAGASLETVPASVTPEVTAVSPPPPPPSAAPPPPPPPAQTEQVRTSNVLDDIEAFKQSGLRKVKRRKSTKRHATEKNSIVRAMFERNQKISGTQSSEDDDDWSLNDSDSD